MFVGGFIPKAAGLSIERGGGDPIHSSVVEVAGWSPVFTC